MVERWDKIEQVCMKRLPGRIAGLECGQPICNQLYPSSFCSRISCCIEGSYLSKNRDDSIVSP